MIEQLSMPAGANTADEQTREKGIMDRLLHFKNKVKMTIIPNKDKDFAQFEQQVSVEGQTVCCGRRVGLHSL